MVRILVMAVFWKAEYPSDYIGQRTELHRDIVGRGEKHSRTHNRQHALEKVFHLHARVRNHSSQLLSVVELLPTRAFPGILSSLFQLWSVRS